MDKVSQTLFGSFPRRVGTPNQFWVFNEAQFDHFAQTVNGTRNAYSTALAMDPSEGPVSDKVFFDLDGDKRPLPDDAADDRKADLLRSDPDLADEVLGDVCDEARRLARASRDDGIPCLGVFSGFGLHIHQLYQRTTDPKTAMTTCAAKYIDECGLDTADWSVVGDIQRICRVPNMERATMETTRHQSVLDGDPTGLWTVPFTREELLDCDPQLLIEQSTMPRPPDRFPDEYDRPQMPVWEEYRDRTKADDADTPQRPVDSRTLAFGPDADMKGLLTDLLQMPCMAERLVQPNPEHMVRFNAAVILFNIGWTPSGVEDLYARLGWVDFSRETTRKHLKDIWQSGYADMSCESLRDERLCTRAEDPSACRCYGWSGGQPEWTS